MIPREVVLSRPKSFFKNIHGMLLNAKQFTQNEAAYGDYMFDPTSVNGWTLERLWLPIFSHIPITKYIAQGRYLIFGGPSSEESNLVLHLIKSAHVVLICKHLSDSSARLKISEVNTTIVPNLRIYHTKSQISVEQAEAEFGFFDGIYYEYDRSALPGK